MKNITTIERIAMQKTAISVKESIYHRIFRQIGYRTQTRW